MQDPYDIKDRGLRAETAAIQPGPSVPTNWGHRSASAWAQHSTAGQARLGDCGGAAVLALVRTQRPRLLGLGALCSEAGPADAVLGAAPPQQHNNNPSIIYTAQLGAQHGDPTITENIRLESEAPTDHQTCDGCLTRPLGFRFATDN